MHRALGDLSSVFMAAKGSWRSNTVISSNQSSVCGWSLTSWRKPCRRDRRDPRSNCVCLPGLRTLHRAPPATQKIFRCRENILMKKTKYFNFVESILKILTSFAVVELRYPTFLPGRRPKRLERIAGKLYQELQIQHMECQGVREVLGLISNITKYWNWSRR